MICPCVEATGGGLSMTLDICIKTMTIACCCKQVMQD